MMRNRLDEQLNTLNRKMIGLSSMCETMIAKASRALIDGDTGIAREVIRDGAGIDQSKREIESFCVKLLLQQQPVAKDLRQISAALKMVTDIERIGDQAEDIAEIILSLHNRKMEDGGIIYKMAKATIQMVSQSIDAFVKKDKELAHNVIEQDDIVDAFFLEMKEILTGMIAENPQNGGYALDLLMISKYFERIGDHAVNIAQWVIYSINGEWKGEV